MTIDTFERRVDEWLCGGMSRVAKRSIGLVVALVLILTMARAEAPLLTTSALANGSAVAEVSLDVPGGVASGSDVVVTVDVSQLQSFDACNYDVSFDPTVLRLDSVTSGDIGGTVIPVDIANENSPGKYTIVQNVPGLRGVSGSGHLAVLQFHVIGSPGARSAISLSNGVLGNNQAKAIPATWTGGSVSIPSTGGGLPPTTTQTPSEPGGTAISDAVNSVGVFTRSVPVRSEDDNAQLIISQGTTGLTKEGAPISDITVAEVEVAEVPVPPTSSSIVGSVYDFGPDEATFDPPINLTLTYSPSSLPQGVDEENLLIAFRDAGTGEWFNLTSTVDAQKNEVNALVSHFTDFTILAYTATAQSAIFTVSDLAVSPSEVSSGEEVTIRAVVSNSGGLAGSYQVTLKIDGEVETTQTVDIAANGSEEVTFIVSRDVAGSYTVDVGGLTDRFTVEATPAPSESQTQSGPMNWPVLWGVVGGVVVLVLILCGLFVLRDRRSRY